MNNSPRLGIPYLIASQAQKEVTHNEMINRLELLVQASVKDILAVPPENPAAGDMYLLGDNSAGVWSGYEHHITQYIGGTWNFMAPAAGYVVWVQDEACFYAFETLWTKKSDIPGIVMRGAYAAETAYSNRDVVYYEKDAWYCLAECTGQTPSEGIYWTKLVSRGDQGEVGEPGPIGINWQGTYSETTAYEVRDAVSYDGSSFYCKQSCTGQAPVDGEYWGLIAQKGTTGSSYLYGMNDVSLDTLADGQALVYNDSLKKWTNAKLGSTLETSFIAPPIANTWTQQNFHASNTHIEDFTSPSPGVRLREDPYAYGNTNTARYALKAIPGQHWEVKARLRRHTRTTSYMAWGLVVRDAASGRSVIFGFDYEAGGIGGVRMSSDTSYNAYFGLGGGNLPYQPNIWLRLVYDGTNCVMYHSFDGVYWTQTVKYAATALWGFLTNAATHIGFGYNANNAGGGDLGQEIDLLSWTATTLP